MAALLPTILSEDEAEEDTHNIEGGIKNIQRIGERNKVGDGSDTDSDGGISSDDEMDGDFEFGGLLGEDGSDEAFGALGSLRHGETSADNSWSYKSALALLSRNDSSGAGAQVERTSVASIIAAARSNLRRTGGEGEAKGDPLGSDGEDGSDDESGGSESSGSSDSESDDDSDGSSSSDDDEVDDADQAAHSMESDVLKVRERPGRKEKKTKAAAQPTEEEKKEPDSESNDGSSSSGEDSGSGSDESDSEDVRDEDDDERAEAAKAAAFFDSSRVTSHNGETIDSFSQLGISRPLLRGVASMGFVTPTPIQASVLPVALAGRDVCASAVTGSGKTAAFLLPVMERILQRGGGRAAMETSAGKKRGSLAATRALILAPTRELAAQCVSMMSAMAKFTDLRAALIVGGAKNVMSQAAELRTRPDVVVATPGRLLDHITNSQGVDMDDVEFLILDEADRLLDLGFQDEVHEIVKSCPAERQTMLFSATMSTRVDDLIKLSLKRPVRILATDKNRTGTSSSTSNNGVEVAPRLEQEFVRIRAGNEGVNRQGMLLALLTRTFKSRTIVFFDTKQAAHRLMIVCGLCGIKCAELHGNLTQVQRLEALEAFREGGVDVLLCTDLAARGLDVPGVEAVVNFEMPSQVETYVHRIGRTARAGRGGKSCTLIGEGRRYLMKEVIKDAEEKNQKQKKSSSNSQPTGLIRSRTIPPAVVAHFVAKINSLEQHVKEVMDAEAVARLDRITEMEMMRVKNIIEHSDSIKARPQKEWFASAKEKISVKEATAERKRLMNEKAGTGTHRMTRKKRRAQEARAMFLEAREEEAAMEEETGKKSKKVFSESGQRQSARASKRKEAQQEREIAGRSLNDDDLRKERKKKQRQKAAASDAPGDGGLFSEERVAFAKKPKKESTEAPAKSSYSFSEFDPNKKRGNKKKAHHAFKSRSKYKRR
mmetsp:Transcript_21764/g.52623  ORF Transcript_21764/g.52623 Transcript_21764/m.52623 type:complete len:941 (+) Transcript_21764:72-2894(+)